jgi:hypothetical protein
MRVYRQGLCAVCLAAMLSACGSVPSSELFPRIAAVDQARQAQATTCAGPPGWKLADLETDLHAKALTRIENVHVRLTSERAAVRAVVQVITTAIQNRVLNNGPEPPDVAISDLRNLASEIHKAVMVVPDQANPDVMLFEDALGFYFTQLFQGNYVDRFGSKLTAPSVSMTIGDSEVAGALAVLLDVIGDFVLRSPVWVDSLDKPTAWYPANLGSSTLKPTAVAFEEDYNKKYSADLKWAPKQLIVADNSQETRCGMDKRKLEIVEYVAQLAGQRASGITGLTLGNLGGVGFSLGAFGKISIGDNQTLQVIARTLLSKTAERIASEVTYRALYTIPDKDKHFGQIVDELLKIAPKS